MWFLARCAFWLAIVFAALPWPQNSSVLALAQAVAGVSRAAATATVGAIIRDHAAELCAHDPAACLATAARSGAALADPAGASAPSTAARPAARPSDDSPRQAKTRLRLERSERGAM